MSPESLRFLKRLLDSVTLKVDAPDFKDTVATVLKTQEELEKALGDG